MDLVGKIGYPGSTGETWSFDPTVFIDSIVSIARAKKSHCVRKTGRQDLDVRPSQIRWKNKDLLNVRFLLQWRSYRKASVENSVHSIHWSFG